MFREELWNASGLADYVTPGSESTAYVQPFATDPTKAWVTAYATVEGKPTSVRSLVISRDVSIWNNAIFAGTGSGGMAVTGNVDIRGSVHILGDGEPYDDLNGSGSWDPAEPFNDLNGNGVWDPGELFVDINNDGIWNNAEPWNDSNGNGAYDPPITTTELSSDLFGTAYIGNNYEDIDTNLLNMIPNPPVLNGQETLNAEIRVKHGMIALNGTATVGNSIDPDGGTRKGSLDGSFVSDGYTGNSNYMNVFSDNGARNHYDLGYIGVKFPYLTGIGSEPYEDKTGVIWPDHKAYFDTNALVVPEYVINARDTTAFSYSDGLGNSFEYRPKGHVDSTTGVVNPNAEIRISGIVKIPGNFAINGFKSGLKYRGIGTIYVENDAYFGNSVLPANGQVFPLDSALGMVVGRNLDLATGNGDAQLEMAGAFYAQGIVKSAKQNDILGTFVANFYDMGSQVPNIYQVPTLKDNLPPAMPGDKKYFALQVKTWRHRK